MRANITIVKLPPPKPPEHRSGSANSAGYSSTRLPIKAPPLPPQRAPLPSEDGYMSTQGKMSLADIALALRDEQLQAKIVHYRADLETNAELDAITQQVIRESTGPADDEVADEGTPED